uniref:Uncharacterized protein n=1 Tax=Lepeophtheirus salmonis TaxID=72036 RepID=A0A0K2UE57_LEPSM
MTLPIFRTHTLPKHLPPYLLITYLPRRITPFPYIYIYIYIFNPFF